MFSTATIELRTAIRKQVPPVWTNLVADAQIEFALASTGPDGKQTNGITHCRPRSHPSQPMMT